MCNELDSDTKVDSIHLDIGVASGNEDGLLVAEVACVENTAEALAKQVDSVFGWHPSHCNVVGVLLNGEVVTSSIVLAVVPVWQLDVSQM